MSELPKCAMLNNGDGTVTILPFKAGCDPLKNGLLESVDGSKASTIPLQLHAPMIDGGCFEDQIIHEGKPLTT